MATASISMNSESSNTMIKKILYVHYQRFERDGSFVHTREFAAAFGDLCTARAIQFSVLAPPLITTPGVVVRSRLLNFLREIWRKLGPYYLRDVKVLIGQLRHLVRERRYLAREKPDIVLMRFEGEALSVLWACRLLGIPSAIELNSPDREELPSGYRQMPGLRQWFTNRHALELAHGAFAVSEQLAIPMRVDCGAKPVMTIPNGVDIERFDPALSGVEVRQRYGIAGDAVVYGFVGSFAPWHGIDLLVNAFTRLLIKHPSIHLLLIGQANAQWKELLDRLAGPDLAPHITITGFVPPKEIPPYLAAMDVTVLPNSAYYCSPLKLFEYMAMAKPTVSVCTSPVAATLQDGEEGLLFPQGNVDALTAALDRLTKDKELRARMGAAARRRIERDYTWKHNAAQVFKLLEEVYSQSRHGTG